MQREYPKAPLVGVGAVIVDAGRVVVIKRGRPPLQGQWSIPGGLLELGETLREAVAREALEETGLVVDVGEVADGPRGTILAQPASGPGSVLGVFDRIVRDEVGEIQFHYVLIDVLCFVKSGKLRAGEDAAEARWISGEELLEFPIEEEARKVLLRALGGGGFGTGHGAEALRGLYVGFCCNGKPGSKAPRFRGRPISGEARLQDRKPVL